VTDDTSPDVQSSVSESVSWPRGELTLGLLTAFGVATSVPLSAMAVSLPLGAQPAGPLLFAVATFLLIVLVAYLLRRFAGMWGGFAVASAAAGVVLNGRALGQVPLRIGVRDGLPGLLVSVGIGLIVVLLAFRLRDSQPAQMIFVTFALAPMLLVVPQVLASADLTPNPVVPVVDYSNGAVAGEDVVIILLDGYGRADVLDQLYGFDNAPFLSVLESAGIEVADQAVTNYSMTIAAFSSALSLNLSSPPGQQPTDEAQLGLRTAIRGENSLTATLQSMGYEYWHLESGWDANRCGPTVDVCLRASRYDEMMGAVLAQTALQPVARSLWGDPFTLNGLRVLDRLPSLWDGPEDSPRVIIAHVVLPHPPLYLGPTCELNVDQGSGQLIANRRTSAELVNIRQRLYIDQLRCVNSKIERVVGAIPSSATVVVTADHGPDSGGQITEFPARWIEQDIFERMSILSAYRLPNSCSDVIPDDVTLTQGFRIVVGCLRGSPLEGVVNETFIYPWFPEPSKKFVDEWKTTPVSVPTGLNP